MTHANSLLPVSYRPAWSKSSAVWYTDSAAISRMRVVHHGAPHAFAMVRTLRLRLRPIKVPANSVIEQYRTACPYNHWQYYFRNFWAFGEGWFTPLFFCLFEN